MELILEMEIIILVEGLTEKRFCDNILKPHLELKNIFLKVILIDTKKTPVGQNYKGGLANYEQLQKELKNLLGNTNPNWKLISTMFDLYRLPKNFPRYEESRSIDDAYKKVSFLEASLADSLKSDGVNIENFLPHLQLHEFEAFMFVDSSKTLEKLKQASSDQRKRYEQIVKEYDNPELINTDKGPSIHMQEAFSGLFQKSTTGVIITESIGLDALRNKCPHFDQWIKKLEKIC